MEQVMEAKHHAPLLIEDQGLVTSVKIVSAVRRIVELTRPVKVLAFGSRARGGHRRESDLDLAVIVDRYDPATDARPIWRTDLDEWMDMDLVVYDVARECRFCDSLTSLQAEVKREGVVLFDRETGRIDEEAAARLV